jgi:hypothetical protein
LAGIPLAAWQRFLAIFGENRTEREVARALDRLAAETAGGRPTLPDEVLEGVKARLLEIVGLLRDGEA